MESDYDNRLESDYENLRPETMERLLTLDQSVDYEEIELKRSPSCQRLGLTLCYDGPNEHDTDIFISQIEPGSVAERCGRLYVGDQILQINGTNVRSRDKAMNQFKRESGRITLLLARPSMDEHEDENVDEEEHVILEQHLNEPLNFRNEKPALLGTLAEHDDSTTENSQAHEKDSGLSGLSRTTDSEPEQHQKVAVQTSEQKPQVAAERNFEHELAQLHSEMENIRLECARLMTQRSANVPKDEPKSAPATSQAQQALSLMNMIEKLSSSYQQTAGVLSSTEPAKPTVVERKSCGTETPPPLTQKQQRSQPQQSPFMANLLQTPKASRKPQNGLQSAQLTPKPLHRQQKMLYDETTSSAYNTGGDSCRSTPNNMHNCQPQGDLVPPRRPIHLTVAQKHIDVSALPATTSENLYHTIETPVASVSTPLAHQFRLPRFTIQPPPPQIPSAQPDMHAKAMVQQQRFVQPLPQPPANFQPGKTMYTTADKLAETIALQQRLLRQAMGEPTVSAYSVQHPYSTNNYVVQNEYHTIRTNDSGNQQASYEWKVKRRADGSRYLTRRPLRSQVLKAREEQLNRERTGLSTDDDAASELKTGKFWSRRERKEHIQRQREKKLKKHQMLTQKQKYGQSDQLIYELSHRKQMRHSGQQFFDKFTTIQEFLTHGSRDPALRPAGGILSVTTV